MAGRRSALMAGANEAGAGADEAAPEGGRAGVIHGAIGGGGKRAWGMGHGGEKQA